MYVYTPEPLRLGLFDLGGVLYHANYFALFEHAREAFLRDSGLPYPKLAEASQHLAIRECKLSFLKPIYYGQNVVVRLTADDQRSAAVTLHYTIVDIDEPNDPLHNASTTLVFIDSVNGVLKPSKMPAQLKSIFESIASSNSE